MACPSTVSGVTALMSSPGRFQHGGGGIRLGPPDRCPWPCATGRARARRSQRASSRGAGPRIQKPRRGRRFLRSCRFVTPDASWPGRTHPLLGELPRNPPRRKWRGRCCSHQAASTARLRPATEPGPANRPDAGGLPTAGSSVPGQRVAPQRERQGEKRFKRHET